MVEVPKGCSRRKLSRLLEEFRGRVIVADGLALPKGVETEPLSITDFEQRLVVNTAKHMLRSSAIPHYAQSIGIIDPWGDCVKIARELVGCCPCVKVYTHSPGTYRQFCADMLSELGAVVSLVGSIGALGDMSIIVAPVPFSTDEELHLRCPVLALRDTPVWGSVQLIHSLKPALSPELAEEIPPHIPHLLFAGAAYTYSGVVQPLESCAAAEGQCKQNRPSVRQVTDYINHEFKGKNS